MRLALGILAISALGAGPAAGATTSAPVHRDVSTTVFWVGERAGAANRQIANRASAWDDRWQRHFGGVDDPDQRTGYRPAGFVPRENAFYVALPYNDYDSRGRRKSDAERRCPGGCKNRWVRIVHDGKVAYAQWEDVGPFGENDVHYVFGTRRPRSAINRHAGLDVSPAVRDFLGLEDIDSTSWRFVARSQVPEGPWTRVITTRGISWD